MPLVPKGASALEPLASPSMSPLADALTPDAASGELQAWFELSPLGQLLFDRRGVLLRFNAPLAAFYGPLPQVLNEVGADAELCRLLGWPARLPALDQVLSQEGWLGREGGAPVHVRVRVRRVAHGGDGLRNDAASRWIAVFEDCGLEDERDVARLEIQVLMGAAGIGIATWDAARGWTGSGHRDGRVAAPESAGGAGTDDEAFQRGLTAVRRDLVEPESMPEFERLQVALRTRTRIEVRYAVHHPERGRRWLMTRVRPAELGGQRAAFSVVTMDVTEEEIARRRNQDLLTELLTILDVSPAAIAYLRGEQLVRCNRRFEMLLNGGAVIAAGRLLDDVLRAAGVCAAGVELLVGAVRGAGTLESELYLPVGPLRPEPVWCSLALRRTQERCNLREPSLDGDSATGGFVLVLSDATRLKTQQAELEALARDRELMFNLSDVGIIYQRDGSVERANQAMSELIGVEPQALKGLPMAALYESESAWRNSVPVERRDMSLLGRSNSERRIRRRDGALIWAQVSQRPVSADQPAAGTIVSFVNIDDRQRARELLVQQADRTRAILDSVLVGIVTLQPGATGIEWMNRSARRMFGGELGDFVGEPISVVATDELDHPLRRTDYGRILEEGQAETFECQLRARDGRNFWVVGNVVATGEDVAQRQLTYALLDIERRRQAEVSILQARASLQRIIETAPLAIALFDAASQQVVQLNHMAATFAGRPMSEIIGYAPVQWLPGPEGVKLSTDLQRALTAPGSVQRELRRGAEEAPRVWDIRIVSLRSAADAPDQLLMVASDVTAQRAADEARLAAAIAQREMLIKEVNHRIKNNLQGVAGLLQQSAVRYPEAAGAIAEAVGQVHAIAQVHGLQVGASGPVRVRGVVEAIVHSVRRMFGRAIEIDVCGVMPDRFALMEADSIPIALTVNELLTNAIKHSAAAPSQTGAPIHCIVVCTDASVTISIANCGILASGFSLNGVPAGVSGLGLVRSLLPRKGAHLSITAEGAEVIARLTLMPPAVVVF